jgi:hypothetical protein
VNLRISQAMKQLMLCFSWLAIMAACVAVSALEPSQTLPTTARWLTTDGTQTFALLTDGQVISSDGKQLRPISKNWHPDAPISFAHGRLHGVGQDGELRVFSGQRQSSSQGARLSRFAAVQALPAGVIAIDTAGDVVRLEANANTWNITARAAVNALTDSHVTVADIEGDSDVEVIALLEPSRRYAHDVLGDAIEPTAIAVFERHSLAIRWRYDLPAPFVFEDLKARPVRLNGRDWLALVRSSPAGGAALVLIGLEDNRLVLKSGPDFRQANRWLNPVVGFGELYAVLTPHIGGILTRFVPNGTALQPTRLQTGVSSHKIGSRNLETAVVLAPGRIALPSQDQQSVLQYECSHTCTLRGKTDFGASIASNMIRVKDNLVVGDTMGRLHHIPLR